jgi:hypothetical protein
MGPLPCGGANLAWLETVLIMALFKWMCSSCPCQTRVSKSRLCFKSKRRLCPKGNRLGKFRWRKRGGRKQANGFRLERPSSGKKVSLACRTVTLLLFPLSSLRRYRRSPLSRFTLRFYRASIARLGLNSRLHLLVFARRWLLGRGTSRCPSWPGCGRCAFRFPGLILTLLPSPSCVAMHVAVAVCEDIVRKLRIWPCHG